MRKRVFCVLLSLLLAAGTVGCAPFSAGRQETTYLDVFDTVTTVTAYGVSAGEFSAGAQRLHALLTEYHRLYDIYHTYEGLQNLCSVNAAAGRAIRWRWTAVFWICWSTVGRAMPPPGGG